MNFVLDNIQLLFKKKYRQIVLSSVFAITIMMCMISFQHYLAYKNEVKTSFNLVENISAVLEQHTQSLFSEVALVINNIEHEISSHHHIKNKKQLLDYIDNQKKYLPENTLIEVINIKSPDADTEKKLVIQDSYYQESTHQWYIKIYRKLNKLPQAVVISLPVNYFSEIYKTFSLSLKSSVAILRKSDQILLARYPEKTEALGKKVANNKLFDILNTQGKLSASLETKSPIDNVNRFFSYRALIDQNIFIAVGLSKEERLADWQQKAWLMITLFSMVITLTMLILIKILHTQEEIEVTRMQMVKSGKMSALGEMAAGVAHEINNPLAIVLGKTMLIKNRLKKMHAETSQEHNSTEIHLQALSSDIEQIEKTAQRIVAIVKGLRTFSRNSETDPMTVNSLSEIINDSLELCREKFIYNNIQIRVFNNTDARINCRATEISQVIMNLLSNSSDAISKSNESRWIELEVTAIDVCVKLTITDSGHGIPQTVAEKMMEPFFTTKEVGKGTGLGLSISKGIIEDHGGILKYDHKYANTRFTIELPIAIQTEQQTIEILAKAA